MTAPAHTPGPWKWDGSTLEQDVPDNNGEIILGLYMEDSTQIDNTADSALIAAAPELLAAAKIGRVYIAKMLEAVKHSDGPVLQGSRADFAKIEAAIAKAEGRA